MNRSRHQQFIKRHDDAWIGGQHTGLAQTMNITTLAAIAAATIAVPATAQADPTPPPCSSGTLQVSNGGDESASGHREVTLVFSLAPDARPCTLTGYPGVDSGAGGPLIHADRTLSGFLGGLRGPAVTPPTITVSPSRPAHAVVEGAAVDRRDFERKCPTYTDLQVTPPNTTDTVTVPATIDTCELQIHPVGSDR
jgi:hypothetical protein